MQLSVIIVNYNVKYFLEQCLASVKKAMEQGIADAGTQDSQTALIGQVEVLVVDNQSTDGSLDYLQPRFPFAKFIASGENLGFAKANNLALAQCQGKYILFLNPDTIVPEDCFQKCIGFMEMHAKAGALGVHMIDGGGTYLPESKRGFPTPWVSFCKMSGLTGMFPSSRFFARYYLGHLPVTATHKVDVLSGAFMWVRKEVLDKTGGFDERFFMYAEDIDLSYRIQKAGYTNYYYADTTIIHFKGESTRRDARYVKQFYTAMIQFVDKHFTGIAAAGYVALLRGMIWLKAKGGKRDVREEVGFKNGHYSYRGDIGSIEEMKAVGINHTATHKPGEQLVLCEGRTFSFKESIQAFQQQKAVMVYLHANNTGSAVASSNKSSQGNTIIL